MSLGIDHRGGKTNQQKSERFWERVLVLPQDLLRCRRTPEFQKHGGFLSDDPAIMTRRYVEDIPGSDFPLAAVVELAGHVPGEAIADMVFLA